MVVLVDDEIQQNLLEYVWPIPALFCFCKNLFDPDENSKILNDEQLTKKKLSKRC